MKKILIISLLSTIGFSVYADDLTAVSSAAIGSTLTGSINLTVSGGAAPYTFAWSGPSGFTASSEDISELAPGTYTVIVNDAYCGTATLEVVVGSQPPTSVAQLAFQNAINVYPNPASDYINIATNLQLRNAKISITDIAGRQVAQYSFSGSEFQIDLKSLSAGNYVIEVKEADQSASYKISKL